MGFPRPDARRCLMYLLRHGATDNNEANPPKLQGSSIDLGLSPAGNWQAKQAADLLGPCPVSAVYASPLRRARETAAAIAQPHGLPVTQIDAITEVDVGHWEGRSWIDIEQEEPEAYRRFMSEPDRWGYAGGENLQQVRDRAVPALARIAQEHRGQAIVVVSHNVVNRCFLATALGLPLKEARSLSQDNAAVNIVRWDGDWKVVSFNSVFHLRDQPTTARMGSG